MFLEECKHVAKEKKMSKYIIKDIEISSDSDKGTSDEENSNEENSDKNTKKDSEKNHVTDIKIFLKKKKTKGKKKKGPGRYQSFTEVEKEKRRRYCQSRRQKLPEYRRNSYLTHKK